VARNAVALGADVGLLGVVGADEPGDSLERMLTGLGIASHLQRDPTISTIVKLRVLGRQQQLLRIDFEEAPTEVVLRTKLTQFNSLVGTHDVIVLSDYAKGGLADVAAMIDVARAMGKTVLVDPKGDDFTRYAGATMLTPNKGELKRIVGSWQSEEQLTAKAQNLRADLKLEALLLTRSEEGMTLYTAEGQTNFPAMAREVFDVSGAGDTVIATMAVMLGQGKTMVDAADIANRAGGIVVGKLGTATVTPEELFPV
jgi:D-glycero-beta-D-manno-heptose-7-phosphate kinase